ncbi:MAG: septum formation protein Maf [Fusobacteria bacterium]|nr:septum formation protein Maf [Fusobacteriota bacterium]
MILASKSPRRKEILTNFGFNINIITENIDEYSDKKKIVDQVKEISYKKAKIISLKYKNEFILAADTVVIYKKHLLGKPKSDDEAFNVLKKLSGKWHKVITAYTLINESKNIEITNYDLTKVKFNKFSDVDIKWYISTKEHCDKAGSYGIQGKGVFMVQKIKGDFYNVMGFPISKFIRDLSKIGYTVNEISKI